MGELAAVMRSHKATTPAKMLTFDIERRPGVYLSWDNRPNFLSRERQLIPSSTISWAAKWYDQPDTMFASIGHKPSMFKQPGDVPGYRSMLKKLRDLLDEADIVIGYNSARFDEAKVRGEFFAMGIPEPSPFRTLDLYRTTRRMGWDYNSLAETAARCGLAGKTSHQGFTLWTDCLNGDPEAWALMEEYNRRDVELTEEVADVLRPYIKDHPNLGLWAKPPVPGAPIFVCPKCASEDLRLVPGGHADTALTKYPTYKCGNCGAQDTRGNNAQRRVHLRTAR